MQAQAVAAAAEARYALEAFVLAELDAAHAQRRRGLDTLHHARDIEFIGLGVAGRRMYY